MSLHEKIGQLFVVAAGNENLLGTLKKTGPDTPSIKELIHDYHVGGIIFIEKRSLHQQLLILIITKN